MARRGSGMPQISAAFAGWTSRITLIKRVESVVDGFVQNTDTNISFYGTIQPLSPREIELKPEGQRSFTWLQIHCRAQALTLIPHDRITYQGKWYKVMAIKDYSLNGYVEYHLCQDFQNGGDSCNP